LEEYDWIETFTWIGKPMTRAEAEARKQKCSIKDFVKPEHSDPEINALQELLFFHTYELEVLFASHYWVRNFLSEVSGRIGFSFEELPFCTYPEVFEALRGTKLDKGKVLKRRNNNYAVLRFAQNIITLEDADFTKINTKSEGNISSNEVKGRMASPGYIVGTARIVMSKKDLHKVKDGDVIVSPMTTTDMVSKIERAVAIVTDEGGITCHAAVISREMNKPCIVGTKIATRVFHDGDLIEVDANNALVRKYDNKTNPAKQTEAA
jgi:phosphoenolpyruvate synthase/pyruvate phosphate dikinase